MSGARVIVWTKQGKITAHHSDEAEAKREAKGILNFKGEWVDMEGTKGFVSFRRADITQVEVVPE